MSHITRQTEYAAERAAELAQELSGIVRGMAQAEVERAELARERASEFANAFGELGPEDLRELFTESLTDFLKEVLGAAGMDVDEAIEDRFAKRMEAYADRFEALLVERADEAADAVAVIDSYFDNELAVLDGAA